MSRRAVLIAGAALLLILASAQVGYRMAYGTHAWWDDPAEIHWCGRTYHSEDPAPMTRAEVESLPGRLAGETFPVVAVTRVPPVIGRPVLAALTSQEVRDKLGVPCAMVVFLQTGPDSFRPYDLVGGP